MYSGRELPFTRIKSTNKHMYNSWKKKGNYVAFIPVQISLGAAAGREIHAGNASEIHREGK